MSPTAHQLARPTARPSCMVNSIHPLLGTKEAVLREFKESPRSQKPRLIHMVLRTFVNKGGSSALKTK